MSLSRGCTYLVLCGAVAASATNVTVRVRDASLAAIFQAAVQQSAALTVARRVMQREHPEAWGARPQDGEAASADLVTVRAEWRRWQAALPTLTLSARRGAYDVLLQRYHAARQAFWDALTLGNIHALSLAFADTELFLAQLHSLFPPANAPPDVPTIPATDDLRRAYRATLYAYRTNWIAGLQCDAAQAQALRTILTARTLSTHTALLDHVATGAWPTVTLTWLGSVYRDLTWQEPYVFAYWYGCGNARALLGDRQGAHDTWRAGLRYFPDSLYLRYHLARTYGATPEEHRRAIRQFERIISATKDPAWRIKAWYHIARRHMENQEYTAALDAAQRAVSEAQPFKDEYGAWLLEARRLQSTAYLRLQQPDDAVRALEQAVNDLPSETELKRELADLLYGLATAHGTSTVYAAGALRWYERYVHDAGESTEALARTAHVLLLLGRPLEARNAAVRHLALAPQSPEALTTIGCTYVAEGDLATAKLFFRKALDVNPAYAPARNALAALTKEAH